MGSNVKILVVENELYTAHNLSSLLKIAGYCPLGVAQDEKQAMALIYEEKPDLVLMDIVLDGSTDGIELAKKLKCDYGISIVFLTAYSDRDTLNRAKQVEPDGYLVKPIVSENDLRPTIEIAVNNHKIKEKLLKNAEKFNEICTIVKKNPFTSPVVLLSVSLASFFAALASKTRLHILRFILKESRFFKEIREEIKKSKSTLSHHLNVLQTHQLIHTSRVGKKTKYKFPDLPALQSVLQDSSQTRIQGMFVTLGDSTRLKILQSLKKGAKTLSELEACIDKATSTLSQHLSILHDENFVIIQRTGRSNLYSLNTRIFKDYSSLFTELVEFLQDELEDFDWIQ